MKNRKVKAIVLTLLIFTFLIPISQVTIAQELKTGAKLVGTSPFLFAEAKLWILAFEVGLGPNLSDSAPSGYNKKPYNLSFSGKLYPIEIMNFSPYLGISSQYSLYYKGSRWFGGVEFDFPVQGLPLSAFAGGGYVTNLTEGFAGFDWHVGVKYKFSFSRHKG